MDRRTFLKTAGVAIGALSTPSLLAACGSGGGGIPEGAAQLNATITTWEFLTGPERPVPILVRTLDNVQVEGGDLQVYLRSPAGEVLGGPFPTTYQEAEGTGFGLHVAEFAVEKPGPVDVVVVEGDRYGSATVNAVAPADSKVPAPGDTAISVPTPTTSDDRGYQQICTQDPPCGMHEISLDEALKQGVPTMVVFATPEFCKTATCGPAVGTIDALRQDGDWGDAAWIHVEIYSKTGANMITGKPINKWALPSEPWLFSIDSAGKIANRLDGPMLPDMIKAVADSAIA